MDFSNLLRVEIEEVERLAREYGLAPQQDDEDTIQFKLRIQRCIRSLMDESKRKVNRMMGDL
jgi:hypothetical protein